MRTRILFSVALSFATVLSCMFGGMLHSAVAHEHGHTHGEKIVWQALHAALVHEKTAAIIPVPFILTTPLPDTAVFASTLRESAHAPVTNEQKTVHRGIRKDRRFG